MKSRIAKITSLGIIAVALIFVPTISRAQDATNTPSATAPKTHTILSFHGKVTAVDTGAETLTVGKLTLNITSTTKIINATNREPAILSDITIGEMVGGSYKKDADGKLDAQTLHIGVKAAKNKKKKAVSSDSSTNSVPN